MSVLNLLMAHLAALDKICAGCLGVGPAGRPLSRSALQFDDI